MSELRIGEKIEEFRQIQPRGKWVLLVSQLPFGEWHILEGVDNEDSARSSLSRLGCRLSRFPDGRYAVYRKPPAAVTVS